MNESNSAPVTPCGLLAQSRQRYGASMAGRNFLPASAASSSRCDSRSSRNFRNMIHVRSGKRSRSPFSPLSLRIMSRADFRRLPSACAVVGVTPFDDVVELSDIELILQFGYGCSPFLCSAEEADDFSSLASRRNRWHV